MSYTKLKSLNINWVDKIDGLTVANAVEYLKTLDQGMRLYCYLDGDTHGCDLVSRLIYDVPMTNKEILVQLREKHDRNIKLYQDAIARYKARNEQPERILQCEKLIAEHQNKLDELILKYLKD